VRSGLDLDWLARVASNRFILAYPRPIVPNTTARHAAKQDLAVGVGVGLGVVGATAAILLGAFLGGRRGNR